MERLMATVDGLSQTLVELTGELRRTNESVQKMTLDVALLDQQVGTHAKEIYAGDNSSRIRTLELHVKGLYALFGFIAVTLGGQLLALLSHWPHVFSGSGAGKP